MTKFIHLYRQMGTDLKIINLAMLLSLPANVNVKHADRSSRQIQFGLTLSLPDRKKYNT